MKDTQKQNPWDFITAAQSSWRNHIPNFWDRLSLNLDRLMDLDMFSRAQIFNGEREKSMPWKKTNTHLEKPVGRFHVCHEWRFKTLQDNRTELNQKLCMRALFLLKMSHHTSACCAHYSSCALLDLNRWLRRWNSWHEIMCVQQRADETWQRLLFGFIEHGLFKWFNTSTWDQN